MRLPNIIIRRGRLRTADKKALLDLTKNNDQEGHVKAALKFSQTLEEIKSGTTERFANISQK